MKLNLGSGTNYKEGWVNIDNSSFAKVDLLLNLDDKNLELPYEDNSVDESNAIDFLEHIVNIIPLMNELWRVMKSDATFHIEVPLAGTIDYYKDPTHIRPWIPETFKYFAEWNTPLYGIKSWRILEMRKENTGEENHNRIWTTLQPLK